MKNVATTLIAAALSCACILSRADAQSTINTGQPATQADLNSLVIRQLATAAASDINGILGGHAATSLSQCPPSPPIFQDCLVVGASPYIWYKFIGGTAGYAEIGSLDTSTGTFGSVPVLPAASTPGGVFVSTAPAHEYATGVNSSGQVIYTHPSTADITGLAGVGLAIDGSGNLDLQPATVSTLGGILSSSAPAHEFATGINTAGGVVYMRPTASDISGLSALATAPIGIGLAINGSGNLDLQPGTSSVIGGVESVATVAHEVVNGISGGVPSLTQLGFGDLTGVATVAQGGTGTATPGLVPGTNITISGAWPNQTINATGGGGALAVGNPISGGTSGCYLSDISGKLSCLALGARYDVVRQYGADPTGAVAADTAISNAMTACNAAASLYLPGTVYVPAGEYKIAAGFTWLPNCNVLADPGAILNVTASIANVASNVNSSSDEMEMVVWEGGQIACNGLVTNAAWNLYYFLNLRIDNVVATNCYNSASGATSGYIDINGNTTASNGLYVTNYTFWSFTNASLYPFNYGIFTTSGTSTANDVFSTGQVIGANVGMNLNCSSCVVDKVHTWVYGIQGTAADGIFLVGSDNTETNNEVDEPVTVAYQMSGAGPYNSVGNLAYGTAVTNTESAFALASGTLVTAVGNIIDPAGSNNFENDYAGNTFGLSEYGTQESQVTNALTRNVRANVGFGAGPALTSGSPTNITSAALSAGRYRVCGQLGLDITGGDTTFVEGYLSTTSASGTGEITQTFIDYNVPSQAYYAASLGCDTVSLSTNGTLYDISTSSFSGTATGWGGFTATRLP